MFTHRYQYLLFALLHIPFAVNAQNVQLDINASFTFLDAGGNDDFETGKALSFFFDYELKKWLGLEAGVFLSDEAQDEVRSDLAGTYQASLGTRMLLLGVKPKYKFDGPFEVYGRLGLSYWHTEIEVEEYFGVGIPGGVTSDSDTGYGYYINLGGLHNITSKVSVQLELSHMIQPDVFEGKSSYPFDLTINSIGIGIGYRF